MHVLYDANGYDIQLMTIIRFMFPSKLNLLLLRLNKRKIPKKQETKNILC